MQDVATLAHRSKSATCMRRLCRDLEDVEIAAPSGWKHYEYFAHDRPLHAGNAIGLISYFRPCDNPGFG